MYRCSRFSNVAKEPTNGSKTRFYCVLELYLKLDIINDSVLLYLCISEVVYGPPEEVTWYLWLVGVCVVVLVILIALLVVAPYIMWRYRNLMVMKIVHYFQKYEDDGKYYIKYRVKL